MPVAQVNKLEESVNLKKQDAILKEQINLVVCYELNTEIDILFGGEFELVLGIIDFIHLPDSQ